MVQEVDEHVPDVALVAEVDRQVEEVERPAHKRGVEYFKSVRSSLYERLRSEIGTARILKAYS